MNQREETNIQLFYFETKAASGLSHLVRKSYVDTQYLVLFFSNKVAFTIFLKHINCS